MNDNANATIREVYDLVDRRTAEIKTAIAAQAVRIEGIDTRLTTHMVSEGHTETLLQLRKINVTLAKYAGALGLVAFLVGLFVKIG